MKKQKTNMRNIEQMFFEKTGEPVVVDYYNRNLSMFTTFGCKIADINIRKKELSKLDVLIERCLHVLKEKVEYCVKLDKLLGEINDKIEYLRGIGISVYRFSSEEHIIYRGGFEVYYNGVYFVYQYDKYNKKLKLMRVINTDERQDVVFIQNIIEGYKKVNEEVKPLLEITSQYFSLKEQFEVLTSLNCE